MKKIIFLLLTSIIWLSCELPDSGRMAVIDFNFTQPDILREAETSAVPDRIIPAESKTVVVVMYPNFSTDNTLEGTFPIEGEMTEVLAQESTKVLYYNFSSGFSGGSLENIEPGIWNFAVFTFNSTISNLTADDMFNVMTWRIKKNVDIVPGINLVDLPLKLYLSITAQNINDTTYSNNFTSTNSNSETIYLSATGFQAGTCRITYDLTGANPETVVFLYSKEGYLIDSTPSAGTLPNVYLTFSPTDSTYEVIIAVSNINPSVGSAPLAFEFFESDYSSGPPQNLTINIYQNV